MKLKNQIELPLLEFFLIAMNAEKESAPFTVAPRLEAPQKQSFIEPHTLWHCSHNPAALRATRTSILAAAEGCSILPALAAALEVQSRAPVCEVWDEQLCWTQVWSEHLPAGHKQHTWESLPRPPVLPGEIPVRNAELLEAGGALHPCSGMPTQPHRFFTHSPRCSFVSFSSFPLSHGHTSPSPCLPNVRNHSHS